MRILRAGLFVAVGLTVASNAAAEIPQPKLAPDTVEENAGPNKGLLTMGVVMLGGAYAGSYIVASSSTHPGDERLYVPVVGPWLDLAERGGCPARNCTMETSNKIVLVGDGIVQGFGVLEIIGAFVFPEKRFVAGHVAATAITPEMIVSPASFGAGGVGVTATGSF